MKLCASRFRGYVVGVAADGRRKPVERGCRWSSNIPGMADGLRFPELRVPAVSRQPALILRRWRAQMVLLTRRYIIWRNNHAYDERLRRIIAKANVA